MEYCNESQIYKIQDEVFKNFLKFSFNVKLKLNSQFNPILLFQPFINFKKVNLNLNKFNICYDTPFQKLPKLSIYFKQFPSPSEFQK